MNTRRILPLLLALLFVGFPMTASAGDAAPDEHKPGEAVERHLSPDQTFRQWAQEQTLRDNERGDRLETRQVVGEKLETVKLRNVVPPIHFESECPTKWTRTFLRYRMLSRIRASFVT